MNNMLWFIKTKRKLPPWNNSSYTWYLLNGEWLFLINKIIYSASENLNIIKNLTKVMEKYEKLITILNKYKNVKNIKIWHHVHVYGSAHLE